MRITGLYIVKNEKSVLERSIKSIEAVCDELIVVDTGSDDGTGEIAKALGAKVFSFDWVDDFSAARNFALSKADGDLIIFMDADEWFVEPLCSADREYLETLVEEDYRVFSVLRSNINGSMLSIPSYNVRMLQGKKDLKYVGAIHESLDNTERSFYLPERFLLHHSGYEGELIQEKSERNITLLYKQLVSETDPGRKLMMMFYVARESRFLGRRGEALDLVKGCYELWHNMPKDNRPANVGICVYDFAAGYFAELGERVIPNDAYERLCLEFIRDFPGHPASYYALAVFYYERHRSFSHVLDAVQRVEENCKSYKVGDYPHDYIGAESSRVNAAILKGAVYFDMGERDKAFDCYTSVLKKVSPTPEFLRRLLCLIKDQPSTDVTSFLCAIPAEVDVGYIEMLMEQLLYFPGLKDVYLYFAVQHLKMTRTQSEFSAIATVLQNDSSDLVLMIADTLNENAPLTAGALFILASIFSGNRNAQEGFSCSAPIERILDDYFSHGSPETPYSDEERAMIDRVLIAILFIGNEEITTRFVDMLSVEPEMCAFLLLDYCNQSCEYDKYSQLVDIDADELEGESRAAFLRLMGRALRSVGDYDGAFNMLAESFELAPSDAATYKELGVLASACGESRDKVRALVGKFGVKMK